MIFAVQLGARGCIQAVDGPDPCPITKPDDASDAQAIVHM